jgi:hypothetical protein
MVGNAARSGFMTVQAGLVVRETVNSANSAHYDPKRKDPEQKEA